MKKRILSLLLTAFLLTAHAAAFPVESAEKWPENPFSDVPDWEWYTTAVKEITEKGLMVGTEPGLFGPEENVTRAMVVVVLWKLEGAPAPQGVESFPDVSADDPVSGWYAIPAAWAREQNIAHGHDDGYFRGEDPVTREELAAFLYGYDLYQGIPAAEGFLGLFSDAGAVSEWAQEPVRHAVGMGYLRGDENGLRPQGLATRAELASVLLRLLTPAVG